MLTRAAPIRATTVREWFRSEEALLRQAQHSPIAGFGDAPLAVRRLHLFDLNVEVRPFDVHPRVSEKPPLLVCLGETQVAARAVGRNLIILNASTESEIDAAFASLVQQRVGALVVTGDPLFVSQRDKVVMLAARHAVPTIYVQREFAVAGGLIGYGTSLTDAYRQVGIYAGRILKGAKPGDLPVVQPTKFDLVINLKTAKALGITIPDKLLALADEVIE